MYNQPYAFIGCEAPYADADTVIFGAPCDSTTSFRPGARFGPAAMRAESPGIETYSPYQDKDLADLSVFDAGDLELPFGGTEAALAEIERFASQLVADGKRPALLGGEHLVTLGAVRALVKACPDLHILHFDAHADLRDDYLGEPLSHACVLRRVWELVGDGRIDQFGIRSGSAGEFAFAAEHVRQRRFDLAGLDAVIAALAGKPVYVTIDLDVLDPSIFPGTGTPEAGGVTYAALGEAVAKLSTLDVRGFDLVELAPHYDASGVSTATACKLLREMLLACGGL